MCRYADSIIGACSGDEPLLRACDTSFAVWCDSEGGDFEACDEQNEGLARFVGLGVECGVSAALPACDDSFQDACDALDAPAACLDDPGTCLWAKCAPPTTLGRGLCCDGYNGMTNTYTGCESKSGAEGDKAFNDCTKMYKALCSSGACSGGNCNC